MSGRSRDTKGRFDSAAATTPVTKKPMETGDDLFAVSDVFAKNRQRQKMLKLRLEFIDRQTAIYEEQFQEGQFSKTEINKLMKDLAPAAAQMYRVADEDVGTNTGMSATFQRGMADVAGAMAFAGEKPAKKPTIKMLRSQNHSELRRIRED